MKRIKPIKRVYVAGPYNADNVIGVLNNIRAGIDMCTKIIVDLKISPFCPWLDFLYQFVGKGNQMTINDYYRYSIDWLEVSDVMLVLPGFEHSKGTQAEISMAIVKDIPIFYDYKALKTHITQEEKHRWKQRKQQLLLVKKQSRHK